VPVSVASEPIECYDDCIVWLFLHMICTDKDRTVRREFNRQIDIPQNVDPKSLRSTLSKDGILQVRTITFSACVYVV